MPTLTNQQKLDECQEALRQLALGRSVVEAWDGEFRVRYTAANIDELRRQISDLKSAIALENGSCELAVRRPLSYVL